MLESALVVKTGQSGVLPAVKLVWKYYWNWRRRLARAVGTSVNYPLSKRDLRRALKRLTGPGALVPVNDVAAQALVDQMVEQVGQRQAWPSIETAEIRERCVEIVDLCQQDLLPMLDPSIANQILDLRNDVRSRQILDRLDQGDALHDSEVTSKLPPYLLDQLLTVQPESPRIVDLATLIARSDAPGTALRGWVSAPPDWLASAAPTSWALLGAALESYGAKEDATAAIGKAISGGIADRGYWQARHARLIVEYGSESKFVELLADAENHPLVDILRAFGCSDYPKALSLAQAWSPPSELDKDLRALLIADFFDRMDRTMESISALEQRVELSAGGALPTTLAMVLNRQAQRGLLLNRPAAFARAATLALVARDRRRAWRGDSAQSVRVAAEARMLRHDAEGAWRITRPEPEGEATQAEATNPAVIAQSALAAASTGRWSQARDLAKTCSDFDRAWIEAVVPDPEVEAASHDEVETRWRALWFAASDDAQRLQAAQAMAMDGIWLNEIDEARDEADADWTQAQHLAENVELLTTAPDKGEIALRSLATSVPAAAISLAKHFLATNRPAEAANILVAASTQFDDGQLLVMAASILWEAGLVADAGTLADKALITPALSLDSRLRMRRLCTDAAQAAGDWARAVVEARNVLELDPVDAFAIWVLASSLVQLGKENDAWRALIAAGRPGPGTTHEAAIMLRLQLLFAPPADALRLALDYYEQFDDETFGASCLWTAYRASSLAVPDTEDSAERPPVELDADVIARLHQATFDFTEKHPDSSGFRLVDISDEENPLGVFEDGLRSRAVAAGPLQQQVVRGELPVGVLSALHNRSYAEVLVQEALGRYLAESDDQGERDFEFQLAVEHVAQKRAIVGEASSLLTLAVLDEHCREMLLGVHESTRLTNHSHRDLLIARDSLALRSTMSTGFDVVKQRMVVTEIEDSVADARARRAEELVEIANRSFDVVPIALPEAQMQGTQAFMSCIEYATANDLALWSDDLSLRRVARTQNIRAFGTVSLLKALHAANLLTDTHLNYALIELALVRYVDLGLPETAMRAASAQDHWRPGAIALALSRPAPWRQHAECLKLVTDAIAHNLGNSEFVAAWVAAATTGLLAALKEPPKGGPLLEAIQAQLILSSSSHPVAIRAIVEGMRIVSASVVETDPWIAAAQLVVQRIAQVYSEPDAAIVVLHIASDLSPEDRQTAMAALLGARSSKNKPRIVIPKRPGSTSAV